MSAPLPPSIVTGVLRATGDAHAVVAAARADADPVEPPAGDAEVGLPVGADVDDEPRPRARRASLSPAPVPVTTSVRFLTVTE